MTDIRQFLADQGHDPNDGEKHQPEVIHYFRATKTGNSVTVCEYCAPPMPTENAWPCDYLKQLAAQYADRPGYDQEWKIDWAREFFINSASTPLEGASDD